MDVFGANGSNPTNNWKIVGAVQRVFDKSVKGYVFRCDGGPTAKMQLPKVSCMRERVAGSQRRASRGCASVLAAPWHPGDGAARQPWATHPPLFPRRAQDERKVLGLVQPYLVLQINVPATKTFSMELSISDTSRARRRLLFSTAFREVRTDEGELTVTYGYIRGRADAVGGGRRGGVGQ